MYVFHRFDWSFATTVAGSEKTQTELHEKEPIVEPISDKIFNNLALNLN